MALNDYEHIDAARKLASSFENLENVVKGGLGPEDTLVIIGEIGNIVATAQPIIEAETKAEAEAKLFAVSFGIYGARKARKLPDGKTKENILLAIESAQKALEVNIVDEPNA